MKAADKGRMHYGNRNELVKICLSGFDSIIKARTLKRRQDTDPKNARKWLEAILIKVVVNGVRLPALNNLNRTKPDGSPYMVEDWGINI